jgi:periplasmic protein TonB
MTAASPGPGPNIFSILSADSDGLYRVRRETFFLSLLGQAAVLGLLVYFTSCVVQHTPEFANRIPNLNELPLIFSGRNGGGGGDGDPLPASNGNLPPASLDPQLAVPTVILPREMPKLPAPETMMVAPDIPLPQGGQIGDPTSAFSKVLSNGPGRAGIGTGCCGGVGPSTGPGAGDGPPGIFPAGRGASVPEVIFNPEPSFSDEARKAKAQGIVLLLLVVGKDGRPYDIHVGQSLGMGLDEKAVEAVNLWRFRPGTLNGQPVATRIAVQVDFHLY